MRRLAMSITLLALASGCEDNRTPAADQDGGRQPLSCLPNLDGRIDADELPVAIERQTHYLLTGSTSVDLVGQTGGPSGITWSYPTETAQDARVVFAAAKVTTQWYADTFPDATFSLANDASGFLHSIYRKDDNALWLLGVASSEPEPAGGRTLFRYTNPVALLRFPIEDGDHYTETGVIENSVLSGLPYVGTDTYEITVDGSGRLELPYVSFAPVLRVYTYLRREPAAGGVSTSRRQVSFMFECFGELARATSQADEANPNFTNAAELRRFAL
jgi:hypothetical protein